MSDYLRYMPVDVLTTLDPTPEVMDELRRREREPSLGGSFCFDDQQIVLSASEVSQLIVTPDDLGCTPYLGPLCDLMTSESGQSTADTPQVDEVATELNTLLEQCLAEEQQAATCEPRPILAVDIDTAIDTSQRASGCEVRKGWRSVGFSIWRLVQLGFGVVLGYSVFDIVWRLWLIYRV